MAVLKNKTQKNFTMVGNQILRDKELSMKDRGVLCTLFSLPDEWKFSIRGLAALVPDGTDSIRSSLQKLEKMGYVKRSNYHGTDGKFISEIEVFAEKKLVEDMLAREDFDLKKKMLYIRKSYQRLDKKDYITEPKTEKSNRDITLPDFLCEELEDYFGMLYKCDEKARIFDVSKHYLQHEMKRGCKESGVKKIRIHDLRHSHVAYLIELGFSPVEIAERMGHESITVTYTYSHLYPSKQKSLADRMNADRKETINYAAKEDTKNE